jgi:Tfp pilus assembly protein PilF
MFYGLDSPGWWHFNNILLHLICVFLAFRISSALGLKLIPAAFCALLFGIHPMRVESVAWVTERKDVLFGVFYLIALNFYINSVRLSSRKHNSFIIFLCFILALLSKIQAVSLPLSMLLIDYYFGRKLRINLVYEKWLYFFIALATGIAGIYFLNVGGESLGASHHYFSIFQRIFIGPYSFVIYVIKSLLPYKMVPIHPYPNPDSWNFYASLVIAPSIVGSTYYFYHTHKKIMVLGILFFTFNIMFLLQTLSAGQGFIADRFTYIAYFGLFLIYASWLQWAMEHYTIFQRWIYLAVFLVLVIYGSINFEQNKVWKNDETLWTHQIKHHPEVFLPWIYRAVLYREEGKLDKALHDHNNAIALNPSDSGAYVSRGVTFFRFNMFEKALLDFNAAEKLDPQNYIIYKNRSNIYLKLGNYSKAQSELEKYISFNNSDSEMWAVLGMVYRTNKELTKSLNAFNRAIHLDKQNLDFYYQRLKTFYEMGDIEMARTEMNFLKSKGYKSQN